jgi:hypothetical protein
MIFRSIEARRLLVLALLAGASRLPAAHAQQSAADITAARDLFSEGASLAQQGKLEEARDRFERSVRLKRAGVTLYSLGVVQKRLGLLVEATESFRAFLAEPPHPQTRAFEKPATEAITELSARVARLRVKVAGGEGSIRLEIDGDPVPEEARIVPRAVNPGRHQITASAPGFTAATETVELREGQAHTVEITLRPEAAAPPASASVAPPPPLVASAAAPLPPPPAPPPPAASPLPTVLLAGGGALFLGGAALGLLAVSQAKNAPTRDGSEAQSARTRALVGDVIGGVGLLGLALGGYWALSSRPTSAARSTVLPWSSGPVAGLRVLF